MYSGYYYDSGHHWGYDDVLWYLDGAVGSFILVLSLVIGILTIAATWLVYRKAGERGWASIVPFYAQYVLYKITWGNGWLFLLLLVPFVNFVVGIITLVKLSKSFGHGGGFACDMENAIRTGADCVAVQTFIGAPGESRSLELLARTVDAATRFGIPTLGVVAVGKDMERTERFFLLATRVLAENGANIVKSYYCEGFEHVAAACPVPIVIAGGKKLPELDALEMAYKAIRDGAHGVDMGRNIFQSDCPAGMAQAIGKVVHEGYTPKQAFEVYQEIKHSQ